MFTGLTPEQGRKNLKVTDDDIRKVVIASFQELEARHNQILAVAWPAEKERRGDRRAAQAFTVRLRDLEIFEDPEDPHSQMSDEDFRQWAQKLRDDSRVRALKREQAERGAA